MNIERHNYEEFFLLYADNELCAADRKAVEMFVTENPDLKKELQLILQTISGTDAVVFNNKELLMKPVITPLQEQLLLFIDNEQAAANTKNTQQLINTDTAAAKEFAALQQTKLQADTNIIYTNKKELYRNKEGRVVRIAWWRAAAAAVLLGFGTWGALTLIKPAAVTEGTVATEPAIKPVQQKNDAANVTADAGNKQNTVATTATNTVSTNTNAASNTITVSTTKKSLPENNTAAPKNKPTVNYNNNLVKENKTNNLPKPLYNNFNNDNRNETVSNNVTPKEAAIKNANSGSAALIASTTKPNTTTVNGYAINASYNPDEAEEANNNKVFYMNEENVKRSKLGGFIRKVKRVVERTANIKTDNSIKVAGFDIALNR
jgi:hypothetical protein